MQPDDVSMFTYYFINAATRPLMSKRSSEKNRVYIGFLLLNNGGLVRLPIIFLSLFWCDMLTTLRETRWRLLWRLASWSSSHHKTSPNVVHALSALLSRMNSFSQIINTTDYGYQLWKVASISHLPYMYDIKRSVIGQSFHFFKSLLYRFLFCTCCFSWVRWSSLTGWRRVIVCA